jgi:hypothetical protein
MHKLSRSLRKPLRNGEKKIGFAEGERRVYMLGRLRLSEGVELRGIARKDAE